MREIDIAPPRPPPPRGRPRARPRPGGRQSLCCALLSGSPGPAERNLSEAEQASVDGEAGAGPDARRATGPSLGPSRQPSEM